MLTEICKEVKNYFCKRGDKHYGTFKIESGCMESLSFLQNGQYFAIWGSVFNDGVHQYPASDLMDEVFEGSVWAMSVPPSLIALAEEIEKYNAQDQTSAFTSESYGGYSYNKATTQNGCPATWKQVFLEQLNDYRRIRL